VIEKVQRKFTKRLQARVISVMLSEDRGVATGGTQCNQRLSLLSRLKYQNLSSQALDIIFQALILSKITYALPSFAGHISSSDKDRINKFFRKAYRRGLVSLLFDIDTLIHKFDDQHFSIAVVELYNDGVVQAVTFAYLSLLLVY